MIELLKSLWTARVLIIGGLLAGCIPIGATFRHIGSDNHLLINSSAHSWHHFFREGVGDFAASAVILFIIFVAPRFRNPALWWVMLITMFGFYAPFWIGAPFMTELAAPSMGAEIAHLSMAVPALLGCFLARSHYFNS